MISRFNQYKFEVTSQIQISDKLQIIYHVYPKYYTVVFSDIKIIYPNLAEHLVFYLAISTGRK